MSQHDYNIANGGGAAVRADINNALLAIQSQNSGATAPTTTKPFMFWYDTTTGVLKMRNAADTAWIAAIDGVSGSTHQGLKNRIINGAMVIDQRNAGASVTPTNTGGFTYVTDRWNYYISQASKFTSQQSSTAATGFRNSLLTTSSSAYSISSSDLFVLCQFIEGYNVADLGWGTANAATVTLSFWVRSSLTGTFGGSITNSAQNRSYPFAYTISSANTWEQKSITIAGDTSGTWLTDNGKGLALWLGLGVGSTYSGTAGSWSGSTLFSATGATSVVGTNGATFYITGVQLEKGSTATSFDYRPYGTELALCQRYFEIVHFVMSGYYNGTNGVNVMAPQNVQKRAQPTVTRTNSNWGSWNINLTSYNEVSDGYAVYCYPTGSAVGLIRMSADLLISAEL